MTDLTAVNNNPGHTHEGAADPTQSVVGAKFTDVYLNTTSGEHFRCVVDTFGSQEWKGSQGTAVPADILAIDHPDLWAYWGFEDIAGSIINDESPNNNDMTNNTAITFGAGYIGTSAQGVAGSDLLVTNDLIEGSFSIGCWVNMNNINSTGNFVSVFDGALVLIQIEHESGRWRFTYANDVASTSIVTGPTVAVDANWYFIAATYDDNTGTLELFSDGQSLGTFTNLRANWGNIITSQEYMSGDGFQDEIRVFRRGLTAGEVGTLGGF